MNYLAGPLTRTQIPVLNALVGATPAVTPAAPAPTHPPARPTTSDTAPLIGSETRPKVPAQVEEYWLPNNLTLHEAIAASRRDVPRNTRSAGLLYRPVLLAQADVRFTNRKYKLDADLQRAVLVEEPDRRGDVRWDDYGLPALNERDLNRRPEPGARFASLDAPLSDGRTLRAMEKDFQDWAYRTSEVKVQAHEMLKVYAGPDVSDKEFGAMCEKAAAEKRKAEMKKLAAAYDKKMDSVENRLEREERELREDKAELSSRQQEEAGTHLETILSLFGGRRRSISSSLRKRRMTTQSRADVKESEEAIAEYEEELEELEAELAQALAENEEKWDAIIANVTEIPVSPYKKDTNVALFGVAWFPYHVVNADGQTIELPGFSAE
jgi:hypothetical protein